MSFLTPLFLVALAGLAIPVLLHLIQKERKNVVQFPSLMFLRRIPYQSVQRRRIRHWLLLMMRLAALALLVLAFARPFFKRQDLSAAAASGAREVVVMLDRSYSMGYGDRWSRAMAAARGAINGLGPTDRGSIVLFASGAEVALRSTGDKSRLLTALAGVESGASATRFGPALKLAGSILGESALPRREAVLISDFQRSGWQGAEGVRLPDGTVLTSVPVTDAEPSNVAVTPVALQRSSFEGHERVTVTAGAINHSAKASGGVNISLEVGGRAVQTRSVNLEPHGSASVTFEPITVADRNVKATVRLGNDSLMRDNAFNFVLSPEEPIRVIIGERPGAPRETSLYLSRALALGESPRFLATSTQADVITADELTRTSVVILNEAPVAQSTAERLHRFVERGGGLFVALGSRGNWPTTSDTLPGAIGEAVDRSSGGVARLGALEYGHPVFEIFRAPRTGDFSAARFYGFRIVTPAAGTQVLARFDDGSAALLERKVGAGRVIVWTSTLDLYWNDLAVKPVFLPFVHRVVRHLASYREPDPWRTVGDVVEPAAGPGGAGRVIVWTSTLDLYWNDLAVKPVFLPFVHRVVRHLASYREPDPWRTVGDVVEPAAVPGGARQQREAARVVLTPAGQRVTLDEEGPDVLELLEQGFYEIRTQSRDSEPPMVVASNVDLKESDLTGMDPQEIVAAAMGRAGAAQAADPTAAPTDQAQEAAQRVWWYLLFAGLLLLGAETLVANRSTV